MGEKTFWYVLYVRSNEEKWVIEDFGKTAALQAPSFYFDVFCPESEFYYRNKSARVLGKVYRRRPLFPGYVFVETDMPSEIFIKTFSHHIYNSEKIVRLLNYGDPHSIAIPEAERHRLEYILRGKRCLEHSVGYIEGDKIVITAGALMGFEGLIKSINRHNRNAKIEIEMFGQKNIIDVALEIVEKR